MIGKVLLNEIYVSAVPSKDYKSNGNRMPSSNENMNAQMLVRLLEVGAYVYPSI